jgi:hypothetical protein
MKIVKSIVIAAAVVGSVIVTVLAQSIKPTNPPPTVSVAWDYTATDQPYTFRVYFGPASRAYTNAVAAGTNHSITISTNTLGSNVFVRGVTYFFAATANDTNGLESDFSSEVSTTISKLPRIPTNIVINTGP